MESLLAWRPQFFRLSLVFETEVSLGAGTAGLCVGEGGTSVRLLWNLCRGLNGWPCKANDGSNCSPLARCAGDLCVCKSIGEVISVYEKTC